MKGTASRKPLRRTRLLNTRLVHLGFKEQQRIRCCWENTRGEWDNTEAEIGPGGTCLPVDTAETSTLTPSELGSQAELWAED